jgi:hypothetical protein
MSDDRFPHLIAAWDVGVDESLTEDHAEPSKLRTFDDTDRLRTCVSTKEYEIMVTYLIICDGEANKLLQERRRRE